MAYNDTECYQTGNNFPDSTLGTLQMAVEPIILKADDAGEIRVTQEVKPAECYNIHVI